MHILLVEDEERTRRALARLLEAMGHRTSGAATGDEALLRMRSEMPDLVLLDMKLDGSVLSGLDVAREKQRDPAIRAIPLVIVSGLPPDDVRREANARGFALLSGAMLIVPKPIDVDLLRRIVNLVETNKQNEPRQ